MADPTHTSWDDDLEISEPTGRDRREAERVIAYWERRLSELGGKLTVSGLNLAGVNTRDWSNRFLIAVDQVIERSSLVLYGPNFAQLLHLPEQAKPSTPMLRQLPPRYAEVFLRGCGEAQEQRAPVRL